MYSIAALNRYKNVCVALYDYVYVQEEDYMNYKENVIL